MPDLNYFATRMGLAVEQLVAGEGRARGRLRLALRELLMTREVVPEEFRDRWQGILSQCQPGAGDSSNLASPLPRIRAMRHATAARIAREVLQLWEEAEKKRAWQDR